MIFNSIEFSIFLPVVFVLYWLLLRDTIKGQNLLLLVASYFFYGYWDVYFLLLIALSTVVDYYIGQRLYKTEHLSTRKILLGVSLFVNLGILFFFKYCNFFIQSFADAFTFFGHAISPSRLEIILPVGISFYTFQTLSYSIDIYKKKLNPAQDFISFAVFVSFFPQLVAGPIERATNILSQFNQQRSFEYNNAVDGMRQILWGLFMKVVIADNCAVYVNMIFDQYLDYSGSTLIMGAVFFAFQIYGDFSGYSHIAIGTARLFGFNLMQNFAYPYFSRDIAEFWRRWHISLSTWFRDYLYIPLGGSKGGTYMKVRNTFIIFLVSGFWHGANWTFIAWGFINACYFLPLLLLAKNRTNTNTVAENQMLPTLTELFQMLSTFLITCVAWVFFRAESFPKGVVYIKRFFTGELFQAPKIFPLEIILLIIFMLLIEWVGRTKPHPLQLSYYSRFRRYSCYSILILLLLYFGASQQEFIYFQF